MADNPEIILLALYEQGGVGTFVDVEDVFVQAYKMAPDRFGWRTKDFPSSKSLHKALGDLERKNPNFTIKTKDGLSRQLTAEGIEWVESHFERLSRSIDKPGANPATRRPQYRILNELRDNPSVQSYLQGNAENELTKYQVADVLLCSPDSPVEVWIERIERLRAAAHDARRSDLLAFLDWLRGQHPSYFSKEGT